MIKPHEFFPMDQRYRRQRFHGPVDEHGNPVRRTKWTHPYSYDGFVLWKSDDYYPQIPAGTIYSDRLYEWDREKAIALGEKHGIKRWDNTPTDQVEAFLRDWNDNPNLRLVLVMEYCNQSSGYPVWRFDFIDEQPSTTTGREG